MRYDKRATVIRSVEYNTALGLDEEDVPELLPCYASNPTLDEVATIYGGQITEAVKLHFQRVLTGIDSVFYNGRPYDVIAIRHHRRATVLFCERSGHHG